MKKEIKNKCIECSLEFISESSRSKFCSIKCRTEYRRVQRLLKGKENEDYIICKWDGKPVGKYMSEYIKKFHRTKTIEDYQNEFPEALIIAPVYLEKISINSGKHMKADKYRKIFSEKFKGIIIQIIKAILLKNIVSLVVNIVEFIGKRIFQICQKMK